MNWVSFVKQYATSKGISYKDALKDSECKETYHKQKTEKPPTVEQGNKALNNRRYTKKLLNFGEEIEPGLPPSQFHLRFSLAPRPFPFFPLPIFPTSLNPFPCLQLVSLFSCFLSLPPFPPSPSPFPLIPFLVFFPFPLLCFPAC